jgi:hypothetical protein
MEPESSLPHLQVFATCLYPEPAKSSPYPYIPLSEDPAALPLEKKRQYLLSMMPSVYQRRSVRLTVEEKLFTLLAVEPRTFQSMAYYIMST